MTASVTTKYVLLSVVQMATAPCAAAGPRSGYF